MIVLDSNLKNSSLPHKLRHCYLTFPVGCKFWPILGNWLIIAQQTHLHQPRHGYAGQALGAAEGVDQGVSREAIPWWWWPPQVHHLSPPHKHTQLGLQFLPAPHILFKHFLHIFEARSHGTVSQVSTGWGTTTHADHGQELVLIWEPSGCAVPRTTTTTHTLACRFPVLAIRTPVVRLAGFNFFLRF